VAARGGTRCHENHITHESPSRLARQERGIDGVPDGWPPTTGLTVIISPADVAVGSQQLEGRRQH
jgi:hypothetical protein